MDFDLDDVRLQFYGEVALHIGALPGVFVDMGLTLGARYYF